MAYSSSGRGHDKVNATINIVPLVDVMLVLLIIFMVTAPLMAHKVKVELPQANLDERPDSAPAAMPITIAVTDSGEIFLNDSPVTLQLLESSLAVEAQKTPQPPVNVRADKTTKYGMVKEVVQVAQQQGMRKVGFVATRESN
ncbi:MULTISPECIES: biopolymer transporter ExbD [unclassified Luteimonas]|uniref:ExbD/TolR family protein n=1 Tax=unclassified Luteimonas TaxID=2629088 RepID=UPI0018F09BD0|nr:MULTISPECIES: biopolymer transporter ExbD [unclassified Luteimonas]MBJ6979231.1 biopolymer transporter ExbD [Luteimonas sp. MC1895]MBJ6985248.1 biopolymer transporter ExbD [Luteimonas sp. MC1750]QQO05894.1 biopolymer transporter ExbD [Luteimonas sp. MC1750]